MVKLFPERGRERGLRCPERRLVRLSEIAMVRSGTRASFKRGRFWGHPTGRLYPAVVAADAVLASVRPQAIAATPGTDATFMFAIGFALTVYARPRGPATCDARENLRRG